MTEAPVASRCLVTRPVPGPISRIRDAGPEPASFGEDLIDPIRIVGTTGFISVRIGAEQDPTLAPLQEIARVRRHGSSLRAGFQGEPGRPMGRPAGSMVIAGKPVDRVPWPQSSVAPGSSIGYNWDPATDRRQR